MACVANMADNTTWRAAAVDCKGNARLQGGDAFEVDISGPASPAPAATVDDNLDGRAATLS